MVSGHGTTDDNYCAQSEVSTLLTFFMIQNMGIVHLRFLFVVVCRHLSMRSISFDLSPLVRLPYGSENRSSFIKFYQRLEMENFPQSF